MDGFSPLRHYAKTVQYAGAKRKKHVSGTLPEYQRVTN